MVSYVALVITGKFQHSLYECCVHLAHCFGIVALVQSYRISNINEENTRFNGLALFSYATLISQVFVLNRGDFSCFFEGKAQGENILDVL